MARFGLPGLLPATVALRARFRGDAGARRHRRLRRACDPAARAAAHRGGRDALRPDRARRGLAGRRRRLAGDRRGARVLPASARRSHRDRARRCAVSPTSRRRAWCCSTPSPAQLADVCESVLPAGYVRRLRRYRYGPGVFKLDWALDGPIPWRDPRCLEASTVHVGGTLEEIAAAEAAVWRGEHPERPFVMVVQQSQFDSSRAPAGKHTGYAYCHVPGGLERRLHRCHRAADRALRAGLPRTDPRPPPRCAGGSRARQSRTTSAARSPAASPTCPSSSRGRWRGSTPTRRRTRGSSSARRRPRRAAACTGCAATSRRGAPGVD